MNMEVLFYVGLAIVMVLCSIMFFRIARDGNLKWKAD
jgi:hypothetical protein